MFLFFSSTIFHNDEEIHIIYIPRGEELFLMAIPEYLHSLREASELVTDIARTLDFSYQTLTKCFSNDDNHESLDHFFHLIFTRLLNNSEIPGNASTLRSGIDITNRVKNRESCEFESILPAAQFIHLPRDAQIQIDAALNEMEAMDYRDWVSLKIRIICNFRNF